MTLPAVGTPWLLITYYLLLITCYLRAIKFSVLSD